MNNNTMNNNTIDLNGLKNDLNTIPSLIIIANGCEYVEALLDGGERYDIAHERADNSEDVIYTHNAMILVQNSSTAELSEAECQAGDCSSNGKPFADCDSFDDVCTILAYWLKYNEINEEINEEIDDAIDEIDDAIASLDAWNADYDNIMEAINELESDEADEKLEELEEIGNRRDELFNELEEARELLENQR